jgi:hypothetical protein
LPRATREQVGTRLSELAGDRTLDPRVRQAIAESFVAGYRVVLWIAAVLALAGSVSAAALIKTEEIVD